MLAALLSGLVVGFVLAIPPGPIGVTAMKLSIDKGLKTATHLSFGAAFMDFVYCMMAFFATTAVSLAIEEFIAEYPNINLILQIILVLAVLVYGAIQFFKKQDDEKIVKPVLGKRTKFIEFLKSKGPFFLGIALALANVANPTFLPSLAYVLMNINSFNIMERTTLNCFIFSVGFGFGNFLWLYSMSRILVRFRDRLPAHFVARIRKFAGLTLIGFGTFLGYRLLPKLAEVLRFAITC
jgi:threonine/homoserine/homoserine lactone efflux protein